MKLQIENAVYRRCNMRLITLHPSSKKEVISCDLGHNLVLIINDDYDNSVDMRFQIWQTGSMVGSPSPVCSGRYCTNSPHVY